MIDLMRTHTVSLFKRNKGSGYLNENNEWVEGGFSNPEDLQCNVQPYKDGRHRELLPDGVRVDMAKVLRTYTKLTPIDHVTGDEGDEIEIGNFRYEIDKEFDFTGYGLPTDHYEYVLIRKDQT